MPAKPTRLSAATLHLALTYLLIIMAMSVAFSFVIYHTSSLELGRQLPSHELFSNYVKDGFRPKVERLFGVRVSEGRHILLARLVLLNIIVLLLAAPASYYLARRQLAPVEQALEAQAQFVSDASHELKTPLTAILASNEVALRKKHLALKDAKEVISKNSQDVARLQSLADGLLSLANDSHADKLTVLDLQVIARESINSMLALARSKQIEISNETSSVKVIGDAASLQQSLASLIDNAVKYSPVKSLIKITTGTKVRSGFVNVIDNGIGIAELELPHIFERFYRSDSSRNKNDASGYGLGLPIAKKSVEAMSGTISVSSRPDSGSVFTIRLPLA